MNKGKCPKCNSNDLSYDTISDISRSDEVIYYPFKCDSCGFEGREYYDIKFSGYEDNDGNEITEKD